MRSETVDEFERGIRSHRDVLASLEGHWGRGVESTQVLSGRVRAQIHRLFHVEVTLTDPPVARLTGWDRDLDGLIPPAEGERSLAGLLRRLDVAMGRARRREVIPATARTSEKRPVGWPERRDAAVQARREGRPVETSGDVLPADATADLVAEVWPRVAVERHRDGQGRESITVRPFGTDRVTVGISRRGTLVVPVADGESVPLPGGRSSITDGTRSQILSALESADEWLRSSAPTAEVLALPIVR